MEGCAENLDISSLVFLQAVATVGGFPVVCSRAGGPGTVKNRGDGICEGYGPDGAYAVLLVKKNEDGTFGKVIQVNAVGGNPSDLCINP